MVLNYGDEGYNQIYAYWVKDNYGHSFNYQGYEWYQAYDNQVAYFTRGHKLEVFSGVGHEDRPFRPVI